VSLGAVAPGAGSAGFDELSKGEIFDLLRNERRRYLLHYLLSADAPVELGEVATRIAAWECDTTVEGVTSDQRKRVYTTLQQTHLPKMDDAQIVDYDCNRGVVRPTEHTDKLNVYLEIVPKHEFPWREYYLAFGAVCTAVLTALWIDVAPFTVVSDLAWATLMVAGFTLSAAVNVYTEHSMRLGARETPPAIDRE
jgi:hypothetical protein